MNVCTRPTCAQNEFAANNQCNTCPPGTTNEAGDLISDTTTCDVTVCAENHRVKNNECVACDGNLLRLAGDKADGADTECFDDSTCGGLICDPIGSKSCVDHICVCNNNFGGPDCKREQVAICETTGTCTSEKKAVPTREELKVRQNVVKALARDILKEEMAKA